jgi:hypothetical protein
MNPFYQPGHPLTSQYFDLRVKQLAKRFLGVRYPELKA